MPLPLGLSFSYYFTHNSIHSSSRPKHILFYLYTLVYRVIPLLVSPDTCRAETRVLDSSDSHLRSSPLSSPTIATFLDFPLPIPSDLRVSFLVRFGSYPRVSSFRSSSLLRRFDRAGRISRSVRPVRGAALVPTQRLPRYNTSHIYTHPRAIIQHVQQLSTGPRPP